MSFLTTFSSRSMTLMSWFSPVWVWTTRSLSISLVTSCCIGCACCGGAAWALCPTTGCSKSLRACLVFLTSSAVMVGMAGPSMKAMMLASI